MRNLKTRVLQTVNLRQQWKWGGGNGRAVEETWEIEELRERERDGEHRRIKTYVLVAFRGGIMWPNATRSSPGSVVAEVEKTKKMWRS